MPLLSPNFTSIPIPVSVSKSFGIGTGLFALFCSYYEFIESKKMEEEWRSQVDTRSSSSSGSAWIYWGIGAAVVAGLVVLAVLLSLLLFCKRKWPITKLCLNFAVRAILHGISYRALTLPRLSARFLWFYGLVPGIWGGGSIWKNPVPHYKS